MLAGKRKRTLALLLSVLMVLSIGIPSGVYGADSQPCVHVHGEAGFCSDGYYYTGKCIQVPAQEAEGSQGITGDRTDMADIETTGGSIDQTGEESAGKTTEELTTEELGEQTTGGSIDQADKESTGKTREELGEQTTGGSDDQTDKKSTGKTTEEPDGVISGAAAQSGVENTGEITEEPNGSAAGSIPPSHAETYDPSGDPSQTPHGGIAVNPIGVIGKPAGVQEHTPGAKPCGQVETDNGSQVVWQCERYPYFTVTFSDRQQGNGHTAVHVVPDLPQQFPLKAPAFKDKKGNDVVYWADKEGNPVALDSITADETVYAKWEPMDNLLSETNPITMTPSGEHTDYRWEDKSEGGVEVWYYKEGSMQQWQSGTTLPLPRNAFPFFFVKAAPGYENVSVYCKDQHPNKGGKKGGDSKKSILNPIKNFNELRIGTYWHGTAPGPYKYDISKYTYFHPSDFIKAPLYFTGTADKESLIDFAIYAASAYLVSPTVWGYSLDGNQYGDLSGIIPLSDYQSFFYWSPWLDDHQTSRTIQLTAEKKPDSTLTYDANGGKLNQCPQYTKERTDFDATLEFDGITRPGYKFLGWSEDPKASSPEFTKDGKTTIRMDKDKTVYAVWQKDSPRPTSTYTIHYDENAPSETTVSGMPANETGKKEGTYNLSRQRPTCSELVDRTYTFAGWSLSKNGNPSKDLITSVKVVDSDVTVYAVWERTPKEQYTVTVHYYKWNADSGHPYEKSDELTDPVTVLTGYAGQYYEIGEKDTSDKKFKGYVYYKTEGNLKGTLTKNEEINVFFKEEGLPPAATYAVHYDANVPEGVMASGMPETDKNLKNGKHELTEQYPVRPAEDSCIWECKGWSLKKDCDPKEDRITQVEIKDNDVTVYAIWERIPKEQYRVTVHYYKWNDAPNYKYGPDDELAAPLMAFEGYSGQEYQIKDISEKAIDGYDYYKTVGSLKGALTKNEEITVFYTKKSDDPSGGQSGGSTDPSGGQGGGSTDPSGGGHDRDHGHRDHSDSDVIIPDTEVPLASQPFSPPEVTIPDQPIPLAANPEEETVADDTGVPLAGVAKLPKTGGIGAGLVTGMGVLLIALGLLLKRKERKEDR